MNFKEKIHNVIYAHNPTEPHAGNVTNKIISLVLECLPEEKEPRVVMDYPEIGKLEILTQDFHEDIGYNSAIKDIKSKLK